MSLAHSNDIPLQALTYLTHIWVQKPLRMGPRQCVEGGAISLFGAYISYM